MPQMAPLNWLTLYILFTLLFLIMVIMNYYNFIYTPKMKMIESMKKTINWKW
nr:ATP synthase F0 subunit 8 [Lixus subtilis]